MDNDLALLHQKIDLLTQTVEAQHQRLEFIEAHTNGNGAMLEKLEYLTGQFETQRRRQGELQELQRDLIPIANHMIKLSIDELAEIGTEFQAEDLWFLLKRLLRDTHMLVEGLDRLEAMMELYDEVQLGGQEVFNHVVMELDRLERQGYFAFARGGWSIVERIVAEFSEEDVQALGDNIVAILTTVKNLTQPEIMTLTNNALQAAQQVPAAEGDVSLWSLVRDLSDPQVRKGLARLLNIVKVLADQPPPPQQN